MSPGLEIHIEELVLHGFPSGDRHAIAEAFREALANRLAAGAVSPDLAGAPVNRIDAGMVVIAHPARPAAVGSRVAAAVAAALGSPAQGARP